MPLETANQIQELNPNWPTGVDPISEGDDHVRLIKQAIQGSFPNMTDEWEIGQEIICSPGTIPEAVATVGQLPTISYGWVDGDGTIEGGSGDFTVAKVGTGGYEITFSTAAPARHAQAFTASAQGLATFSGENIANVYPQSTTVCEVGMTRAGASATDQAFSFTRIVK